MGTYNPGSASTLSGYYEQWLKVASKGNVTYAVAWATDRMMLHCKQCDLTLVAPIPGDVTVIDYSVQAYVKLHRHESPDKVAPRGFEKPIPVTADFKPVKRKKDWEITEGRRFR